MEAASASTHSISHVRHTSTVAVPASVGGAGAGRMGREQKGQARPEAGALALETQIRVVAPWARAGRMAARPMAKPLQAGQQ